MSRYLPLGRRFMPFAATGLFSLSLRSGIPVLIACVYATLIGSEVLQLWQIHRANIEQTDIASSNTARAMAEQAETTLQTADTIAAALVKQAEAEGTGPEALARLHRLMTSLAEALPAIHEMGIVDSQGNAIAKSLKTDLRGLNYAEREYFRYHATHDDRGPFMGALIQSKIDDTYSITVTRRLNNPDGSFGGLAVTSVSLDFFQQLFNRVQAKSGGVISLVSDDNTLLARAPTIAPDMKSGRPFETVPRLSGTDDKANGLSYQSTIDGVWRRGSFARLNRFPVTALVSQSEWDLQQSWRAEMISHTSIMGCVMLVLLVLGRDAMRASGDLAIQALHDGLTGLPNRRAFDETIEREIRRTQRSGQPLSIILIDVDHFKQYNDHFGHPAGDECLRRVARAIRGCLRRSGEFAARYGGEEFAVLLPGTTPKAALALAETMLRAIRNLALPHAPAAITDGVAGPGGIVTLSAGVATSTAGCCGTGSHLLVQAADSALYAAKAAGRDRVSAA